MNNFKLESIKNLNPFKISNDENKGKAEKALSSICNTFHSSIKTLSAMAHGKESAREEISVESNRFKSLAENKQTFLSREQATSCVVFASLSSAAVQTDKSWGEEMGWALISPSNFKIDLSHICGDIQCLDSCFFDSSTGFKVLIFQKGQDYIISFGPMGSESNHVEGHIEKALLKFSQYRQCTGNLSGQKPKAFEQSEQFIQQFNRIAAENNCNVTLTGMCLGAGLATYAALKNNLHAICFNSFPLGSRLQDDIGEERLSKSSQHICHIITEGDFVGDSKVPVNILGVGNIVSQVIGFNRPQLFGKQYSVSSAYENRKDTHQFIFGSLIHSLGYNRQTRPRDFEEAFRKHCSEPDSFLKLFDNYGQNSVQPYSLKSLRQDFSALPKPLINHLQSLQNSPYNIQGQVSRSIKDLENFSISLYRLLGDFKKHNEINVLKNETLYMEKILLNIHFENLSALSDVNKDIISTTVSQFHILWHKINDLMGELMQRIGAIEDRAFYHYFDSCDFSGKGECHDISKISLLEGKNPSDYSIDKPISILRTLSSEGKIASKPKIHISYIRAGWGHVMATRAIAQNLPDCSIKSFYFGNLLETGVLKNEDIHIFDKAFNFLMKNELTAILNGMQSYGPAINKMFLPVVTKKLCKYIERERPDLLISTHPLFNAAYIQAARQFQLPLLIVSTDLGLEDFNLFIDDKHTDSSYQNYAITATYSQKEHEKYLGKNGAAINKKIEYDFGYPTRPTFFTDPSAEELNLVRKEFSVQPNESIILITLGGNAGFSNETCSEFISYLNDEQLNKMFGNDKEHALRVICLCGDSKDPKVKAIMEKTNKLSKNRVRFTAAGRTEKMSSLMSLPELKLVIAKAGGSTTREMEAKGKTAIYLTNGTALNWEKPNIEYGESNGIARRFDLTNKSPETRDAFLKTVQECMQLSDQSNRTSIDRVNFSKSLRSWIREALDRTKDTRYSEFPCNKEMKNVVSLFEKIKEIAPELPWEIITKNLRQASPLEQKVMKKLVEEYKFQGKEMVEFLKGGYTLLPSKLYEELTKEFNSHLYKRISSHSSESTQYAFRGVFFKELLFGTQTYHGTLKTWIQLERSQASDLINRVVDWANYKMSKMNIGPYGNSTQTEDSYQIEDISNDIE